jgi:hypothetical protein
MSAIAIEASTRGAMRRAAGRVLLLPVGLAALWGLWEGYRWLGIRGHWTWPFRVNDTNMPHLSKIWHAFGQPLQPDGPPLRHYLWHYSLFTGKEALAGFALGALIGFLLAVVLAHSHSRTDYNLYEGTQVTGTPEVVLLRGQILVEGDELVAEPGIGQFVPRAKFGEELKRAATAAA